MYQPVVAFNPSLTYKFSLIYFLHRCTVRNESVGIIYYHLLFLLYRQIRILLQEYCGNRKESSLYSLGRFVGFWLCCRFLCRS